MQAKDPTHLKGTSQRSSELFAYRKILNLSSYSENFIKMAIQSFESNHSWKIGSLVLSLNPKGSL